MTIQLPPALAPHVMTSMADQAMPAMPAPASAAKFDALMQQPLSTPSGSASGSTTSLVEAISHQDNQLQEVFNQAQQLSNASAHMPITEMYAASGKIALNLAAANFDFQTKMAVVESSRSSAETLMKNQ